MKLQTVVLGSVASIAALVAGSAPSFGQAQERVLIVPQEQIRFVEARELDFAGELKVAIETVAFVDNYGTNTLQRALELGQTLDNIGEVGMNSIVATVLCTTYNSEVDSRKQNYEDYYQALTSVASMAQASPNSENAEPTIEAITAVYEEDPDAFVLYGKAVGATTKECRGDSAE